MKAYKREEITEEELAQEFEDVLSDSQEPITVCGLEFAAGTILKKLDPIAFRCYLLDYIDSLIQDGQITEENDTYYRNF